MPLNPRVLALEHLVTKYEKSLADFAAINEELRTLPSSQRLTEILELNEQTVASTRRLLECARTRLEKERSLAESMSPFPTSAFEAGAMPAGSR